jgi:DNA polymerase III delta' subunit
MARQVGLGLLGLSGNEALQKRLVNYLKGGRIHPALILGGPDREAKFALARNIAKFLLCRTQGGQDFCDECSVCRRIEKELHPDVLILREEPDEPIKIDTIREIIHQMTVSPIEATHKVCLIDECHRMNTAAANAFLKTLEEPGANRLFLLLTSQPGSLLPTITSRCLEFSLKPATAESEVTFSPEQIQLFNEALQTGDTTDFVASLKEKEDCVRFARFLQRTLREEAASGQADPGVFERFDAALELEGRLRSNANYALMVDGFLRSHYLAGEVK